MIRLLYRSLSLGLAVLVLCTGTAWAEQRRDQRDDRMEERRERMRALREEVQRQAPPERNRRENLDRPNRDAGSEGPANFRRLSPEERRQLRRDVRDAANEVYRR